jgi:pimeloyl-ACP methyl ester carboxylesterase
VNNQRIIYVTGMKPKPPPELHRPALVRVLAAALGRIDPGAGEWLGARDENFLLVSWTSLLYSEPQDIAIDLPGIEALLMHPTPSVKDIREADALWRNLIRGWHLIGDSYPWLSRIVASQALNVTLTEVRRYLENQNGVAIEIRQRLIDQLLAAWEAGDRVLLIGHSLGSVIAYDSLWQLSREIRHPGRVELFLTLGSPLATRFIRKGLQGADRSGPERFPDNIDHWVNASARGELVALHRRVKPFFADMVSFGLVRAIDDLTRLYNHFRRDGELNVHKSYGYLNHPVIAAQICRWLAG